MIKTLLRRETRGVIFSWWRWAVFALCWTPWGWEHNIPRLISCDASWKQPRDGVNIRVRRPLLPRHDPRDRNELNKAILSARVTPQWILMNFFTIPPHFYCALFEKNKTLNIARVGLEYFCEVSLFHLMTAAEFWVSALRLTLGFTQCREKEGELQHLLILPATSWDRVSRDYLRAPILRFSEQERITGAELRAPSLRQRYRVSRPRALIALFALAKLWINILILHAACFYSKSSHYIPRKSFYSYCWVLFWLFENDGELNLSPLCFTSSQFRAKWSGDRGHMWDGVRSLSAAKLWHLDPGLEF